MFNKLFVLGLVAFFSYMIGYTEGSNHSEEMTIKYDPRCKP